ncbi:hypothetical protein NKJ90_30320 [Mesorhizobium sp. M0051]|uniref:hypothetical protein n=1 Tax=Mesorhizobium sp. M0051 TaxID=2956862 RepID=UPI003336963D
METKPKVFSTKPKVFSTKPKVFSLAFPALSKEAALLNLTGSKMASGILRRPLMTASNPCRCINAGVFARRNFLGGGPMAAASEVTRIKLAAAAR